jgi:hypothetical protein
MQMNPSSWVEVAPPGEESRLFLPAQPELEVLTLTGSDALGEHRP